MDEAEFPYRDLDNGYDRAAVLEMLAKINVKLSDVKTLRDTSILQKGDILIYPGMGKPHNLGPMAYHLISDVITRKNDDDSFMAELLIDDKLNRLSTGQVDQQYVCGGSWFWYVKSV